MSVRGFLRNWSIGTTAIFGVAFAFHNVSGAVAVPEALAVTPTPGMAGTDTALPLTDSAVTVRGRGQFSDLEITVNQTRNLTHQAVSLTWTGGVPTERAFGAFDSHFLQIMQCWGDPVVAADGSEGPPPEQCEFGATREGLSPTSTANPGARNRVLSRPLWPNYDSVTGYVDGTGAKWRPFVAVDGTVVNQQADPFDTTGQYWKNPYFDLVTTNEIAASRTLADGHGEELMEIVTGVQSSGLGCGQKVEPFDGGTRVPRCWIVIVPRGDAATENAGTTGGITEVNTSPMSDAAWANRIAIPIEFNPVESPCQLGSDERRMAGNEMALAAVANWQPALCTTAGLPPFAFAKMGDSLARQQLINPAVGGPGMLVVSNPADPDLVAADNPVVYSPLTLSGLVIGFNIDRVAPSDVPEMAPLANTRVATLNLTPRLVAKLLTQSYKAQLEIFRLPSGEWFLQNPSHLGRDPDFLQFNPEFELLDIGDERNFSGLHVPSGESDAARALWQWVLADPEAAAWLAGEPDEWGMTVNPYYSTNPELNPVGVFGDPPPSSFPKSEPYCFQAPQGNLAFVPPVLCGTDWMPYTRGLDDSAQVARTGNDGARIDANLYPQGSNDYWKRAAPQPGGNRLMLVVSDTPSAARLGIQTARLSRAGDDGTDRQFVAPDESGLLTALASMKPSAVPGVLQAAPAEQSPGAYPLTMLTYAAVTPLKLDEAARADYAAFIEYVSGAGQVEGLELGKLPPGYVSMSADLVAQAAAAAQSILDLQPTPTTTTTTATTTTTTTTVAPQPVYEQPVYSNNSGNATNNNGGGRASPSNNQSPTVSTAAPPTSAAPVDSSVPESVPPTSTPAVTSTAPPIGDEPSAPPQGASVATPFLELGQSRMAVPALGSIALAAALGALEITKRPRRRLAVSEPGSELDDLDEEPA